MTFPSQASVCTGWHPLKSSCLNLHSAVQLNSSQSSFSAASLPSTASISSSSQRSREVLNWRSRAEEKQEWSRAEEEESKHSNSNSNSSYNTSSSSFLSNNNSKAFEHSTLHTSSCQNAKTLKKAASASFWPHQSKAQYTTRVNHAAGNQPHSSLQTINSMRTMYTLPTKASVHSTAFAVYDPASNPSTSNYRTELCSKWIQFGHCTDPQNCTFAHGSNELREKRHSPLYKTQPCVDVSRKDSEGCPYGSRCNYAHLGESLRLKFSHTNLTETQYFQRQQRKYPNQAFPGGVYL